VFYNVTVGTCRSKLVKRQYIFFKGKKLVKFPRILELINIKVKISKQKGQNSPGLPEPVFRLLFLKSVGCRWGSIQCQFFLNNFGFIETVKLLWTILTHTFVVFLAGAGFWLRFWPYLRNRLRRANGEIMSKNCYRNKFNSVLNLVASYKAIAANKKMTLDVAAFLEQTPEKVGAGNRLRNPALLLNLNSIFFVTYHIFCINED